jgi:hypothetical protein
MKTVVAAITIAFVTMASADAQEVLDRVVARVDGDPLTLSDVRAAIKLGIVETPEGVDPILSGLRLLIERKLVLAEVTRFAPGEPDRAMLDGQVNALITKAGGKAGLAELERTTGIGETQVREIARDNLRMQAYLNQRFGASAQPTDEEVGQYYRNHLDDFRNASGVVVPFVEAEPVARQRAAAERRDAIIFQWMRELRQRADVVELYPPR